MNALFKNHAQIQDRDLAYEVFLAKIKDSGYGPVAEAIKQSIGTRSYTYFTYISFMFRLLETVKYYVKDSMQAPRAYFFSRAGLNIGWVRLLKA